MSPSKGPVTIDYDDPKYRITPVQQAAASCTGALITSLISKLNGDKTYSCPSVQYLGK